MASSSQPTGERIVDATGLSKTFRDFWMRETARAVDGISFHINRHEIFGLLGPNGSGKSTTIKMILGLLHKSAGRLVVFGHDPSDVLVKRKIGYLPEETYLYRFLNPEETLDFYGKLFGLDRRTRKRRTGELLEMVGLEGVAHRAAGEFSKGMARRLGLAQALVNDPELLILDEPTSGLDPLGTKQVKELILELARRGKTILLTSHLLADVEDVCDRMVILYGGKIRAEGTSQQLLADSERTLLRTPRLSEAAIKAVEQALQSTQGVALESVEAPRQSLEALFLDIVEKARAEQLATSGAKSGGRIAAFLQSSEAGDGSDVVDRLVRAAEQAPQVRAEVLRTPEDRRSSDRGVLDELMGATAPPQDSSPATPSQARGAQGAKGPAAQSPNAPAPRRGEGSAGEPDLGVIDSLLDGGRKPGDGGAKK